MDRNRVGANTDPWGTPVLILWNWTLVHAKVLFRLSFLERKVVL